LIADNGWASAGTAKAAQPKGNTGVRPKDSAGETFPAPGYRLETAQIPWRYGQEQASQLPGRAGGPRKCVILRDRSLPSFGHRSGTGYSAEMPGWHAKAATAGGCLQLSDRSRDSMQDVDLRNFVRVISACTLGLWAFAAGLLIGVFWLS
jgi:hypothetical protein